jgi:hypothetical protein
MRLIVPRLYRTGDSAVVEVTDQPVAHRRTPQLVGAFGRPVSELDTPKQSGLSSDATAPGGKSTDINSSTA